MSDLKLFILGFFILVACFAAVIGTFGTMIYFSNMHNCTVYQKITGRETKYAYGDCYVKVNNSFILYDELKLRAIANEK